MHGYLEVGCRGVCSGVCRIFWQISEQTSDREIPQISTVNRARREPEGFNRLVLFFSVLPSGV